jgi:hypothetical protein
LAIVKDLAPGSRDLEHETKEILAGVIAFDAAPNANVAVLARL